MKTIIIIALVLLLASGLFGCRMGNNEETTPTTGSTEPPATTAPVQTDPIVDPTIMDPTIETNIPDSTVNNNSTGETTHTDPGNGSDAGNDATGGSMN